MRERSTTQSAKQKKKEKTLHTHFAPRCLSKGTHIFVSIPTLSQVNDLRPSNMKKHFGGDVQKRTIPEEKLFPLLLPTRAFFFFFYRCFMSTCIPLKSYSHPFTCQIQLHFSKQAHLLETKGSTAWCLDECTSRSIPIVSKAKNESQDDQTSVIMKTFTLCSF